MQRTSYALMPKQELLCEALEVLGHMLIMRATIFVRARHVTLSVSEDGDRTCASLVPSLTQEREKSYLGTSFAF